MFFIAHTVKGLEEICLKELTQKIHGFHLIDQSPKSLIFESVMSLNRLPQLQSIDDLGIFIQKIESHTAAGTAITEVDILSVINETDFSEYIKLLGNLRAIDDTFSITLSNFKNRNINVDCLKSKIASLIGKKYDLEYTERLHDNFDIRISIGPKIAYMSAKIYAQSLFHRDYRKKSQKGALRPSIAGAMVFECLSGLQDSRSNSMANSRAKMKVVDNFCGSGTILCEALMSGHEIFGGDISRDSVQITKNNISAIDHTGVDTCRDNIKVLDATNTSWPDNTFDVAISNLPWDKQIEVDFVTKLYADTIKEYSRILKTDGILCLIGTRPEIMLKYVKLHFGKRDNSVYKLGYLGQTPSIVLSRASCEGE